MNRLAAPGATIILLTWCHRDLSPLEQDLHPDEKKLLNQMESGNRVKWISAADYINLFKSCSLQVLIAVNFCYSFIRSVSLSFFIATIFRLFKSPVVN